ncbi:hypothetical protein [Anaerosacchariphilus polymeriproducens]|uniref:Uncharacterized protein n=1 Tax=Anaerosacchariphilus polymeriproducens TaxID=1812858 RepID=A0A371AVK0_9FIRM|nr:hypothetical protein [Anaerosacchariphilus polymeriproducens]RDU23562.1 hypothetical protein DWV06_08985 [Anaerosacchariphilus polymeriproducens]
MKKNKKKTDEKEQYRLRSNSSAKIKIIFSSIALILTMFYELFYIINYNQHYEPIIIISFIIVILMYILVSTILNEKEIIEREHIKQYEDLFKSEKASFLLIRRNFEKFNEKLDQIDKRVGLPNTEFLEIQKRLTKIILAKNIENTKTLQNEIQNSMKDISSKLDSFITNDKDYETVINNVKDSIVTKIELLLNENNKDFASQLSLFNKDFSIKQQQMISQTDTLMEQEKEIIGYIDGLGQALGELNLTVPSKSTVESKHNLYNDDELKESLVSKDNNFDLGEELLIEEPKEIETEEIEIHNLEESKKNDNEEIKIHNLEEPKENDNEEIKVNEIEETTKDVNADPNKMLNADEIAAMFASVNIDKESEEDSKESSIEEQKEEEIKETPIIEVSGDPNKQLSADEIAALFASVGR